jgi:hypothetical protein
MMRKFRDGDQILADVSRALEEALGQHGVQMHELLGVTTVLEAIASPLKFQNLQGRVGQEMGRLGQQAYEASTVARKVALLQSPDSPNVNPLMECIVVALQRAKVPLDDAGLHLAAYRVFLSKPRATIASAEREILSLAHAFSSACDLLTEGKVISRTSAGVWKLNDIWDM